MGNSKSSVGRFKSLDTSSDTFSDKIGINISTRYLEKNFFENVSCELINKCKTNNFLYFKLSDKLSKLINNDITFEIEIFKIGSSDSRQLLINSGYRNSYKNGVMKENIINKTVYYDYYPNDNSSIILRHDKNRNLIKIVIRDNPFL